MKLLMLFLACLWAPILTADAVPGETLGHLTGPLDPRFLAEHHLYDVIWGDGLFVAVGQADFEETEALLSSDGQRWERVSLGKAARPLGLSGDGAGALYGVAWNGSTFAAVGERILTSPDGKSWTVAASFSSCVFSRIAAHESTFVAVGADRGRGCIATSVDGVAWVDRTAALPSNTGVLASVAWTGSAFWAIGNVDQGRLGLSSVFFSSADGVTWSRQVGPEEFLVGVAAQGALLVAVGGLAQRGAIFASSDNGQTWTEGRTSSKQPFRAVTRSDSLFVAVGREGVAATSLDGVNWAERQSGVSQDLVGVVWNGSLFVTVGDGAVATSPDGMQWKPLGGRRR